MVHPVVVEPEEALLLPLVPAGRPIQVKVVAELLGEVALVLGAVAHRVVRVAVAFRGGVPVVQVGEEGPVRGAEVLPVQPQRVLVQVVLEPDQHRFAVFRVDPRAREGAVEAVDRAHRQGAGQAGGVGLAGGVERRGRAPVRVDRQHLRAGEGVLPHQQVDLVDDRVRVAELARPDLMPLVAQRILLTLSGSGRARPGAVDRLRHRGQRLGDGQRVGERREDQRAGGERLDVGQIGQSARCRREDPVCREQALLCQVGLTPGAGRGQRSGSACRPRRSGRRPGATPSRRRRNAPRTPSPRPLSA